MLVLAQWRRLPTATKAWTRAGWTRCPWESSWLARMLWIWSFVAAFHGYSASLVVVRLGLICERQCIRFHTTSFRVRRAVGAVGPSIADSTCKPTETRPSVQSIAYLRLSTMGLSGIYRVSQKSSLLRLKSIIAFTSSKLNRFLKFFHRWKEHDIYNNSGIIFPIIP